ncbi:MAG: ribonuclease, partial [Rhizorhabdus sp.]|nr:ribonuclease [Rhizorhabdus sp.]
NAVEGLRQRRMALRRRYKIQDVIRRRQVLLVQVVKEERGNKGAALTTYLSLAGRYCVLMPNTSHGGGISRKISNVADRKRLKTIMAELNLPRTMGCIVRTAGLQRTKVEIKRDFDYLARLWDEIRENTLKSEAPALIYGDSDLIKRAIRDIYNREIDEVIIEGEDGYRQARSFMKLLMPGHARKVQYYADAVPLFQRFGVEDQLAAMYQPIVQLKSGGYLVINPTEALVSIDINSGRSTREHNIEQTATATNLEAAHEIARQLRLRDMAGLVVIDFIDMENNSNIRKVEKAMKEALRNDRARIQVGRISSFGLFEMSRQRIRTGVLEASTRVCPHCEGTGLVRTASSAGISALRMLEEEAARGRGSRLLLRASQEAALYILNRKRPELAEIEERYGVLIEVISDGSLEGARMVVEAGGPPPAYAPRIPAPMIIEADDDDDIIEDEIEEIEEEEGEIEEARQGETREEAGEREGRNSRRRRRRRGKGRGPQPQGEDGAPRADEAGAEGEGEAMEADAGEPVEATAEANEEEGEGRRRRGRRGRRSGRRRGGENGENASEAGVEAESEEVAVGEPEADVAPEPVAPAAEEAPAPKGRRRPRARKADVAPVVEAALVEEAPEPVAEAPVVDEAPAPEPAPVAKKPRAPRRKKADAEAPAVAEAPAPEPVVEAQAVEEVAVEEPAPKPKRRSRAKAATSTPVETSIDAPVADAEPEASSDASGTDEAGSPRRGWWQRTFGA